MKLWLDDVRQPPEGWAWARTVPQAQRLLEIGNVTDLSCDNDLGEGEPEGYTLLDWVEERVAVRGIEPPARITVHSSNAARRPSMQATIQSIEAKWAARKS